ncbi:hypothetical protein ACWEFD_17675 [Streptomyces ardesiacus]
MSAHDHKNCQLCALCRHPAQAPNRRARQERLVRQTRTNGENGGRA